MEHVIAAVGVCPSVFDRLRAKRDAMKLDRPWSLRWNPPQLLNRNNSWPVLQDTVSLTLAAENQSLALMGAARYFLSKQD